MATKSRSERGSVTYVDSEQDSRSEIVGSSLTSATLGFYDLEKSLKPVSLGFEVCKMKQGRGGYCSQGVKELTCVRDSLSFTMQVPVAAVTHHGARWSPS